MIKFKIKDKRYSEYLHKEKADTIVKNWTIYLEGGQLYYTGEVPVSVTKEEFDYYQIGKEYELKLYTGDHPVGCLCIECVGAHISFSGKLAVTSEDIKAKSLSFPLFQYHQV